MRAKIVFPYALAAVIGWGLTVWLAFFIPGSPYREVPAMVDRVSNPETGASAFQDFLALGERTERYGAIVFPLAAAIVVGALSRFVIRLRSIETAVVTALFAVWVAACAGFNHIGWYDVASVAVFALVLTGIQALPTRATATLKIE